MNATDVRLFMEVTKRQAEEAFRRQMDESNRRIEVHRTAARVLVKGAVREPSADTREAWWTKQQTPTAAWRVIGE